MRREASSKMVEVEQQMGKRQSNNAERRKAACSPATSGKEVSGNCQREDGKATTGKAAGGKTGAGNRQANVGEPQAAIRRTEVNGVERQGCKPHAASCKAASRMRQAARRQTTSIR